MIAILNVGRLPFDQEIELDNGGWIHMRQFLDTWRPILRGLAQNGVIKPQDSFGFAMMTPIQNDDLEAWISEWNHPYAYTWFVGGWGPDGNRYIANAVRKIRPLLRRCMEFSTLDMVLHGRPGKFQDIVDQIDGNGNFPWGDFPYGGAARVSYGPVQLIGACSAFTQFEDHLVTELILGDLARRILAGCNPPQP